MDRLARGYTQHLRAKVTGTHDFLTEFRIRLHYADNVTDGVVRLRPHYEVRASKEEEVKYLI